jgi:hypothetical protein
LELFNNKRRQHAAWAKGLMFGKAVGARDERDRIIEVLDAYCESRHATLDLCQCPNQISIIASGKELDTND